MGLPGSTTFVTAGRFSQSQDRQGQPVGRFVYGRSYRERAGAVELDPVQQRLRQGPFETARLGCASGRWSYLLLARSRSWQLSPTYDRTEDESNKWR